MNYNCLIVDDERPALKLLKAYINKLPYLQLADSSENAMQAISALQKHEVDILFLDIQMPDLTGLDLLKVLKIKPQVILTTAYREYAVEGFELDVTDYLVKPFSFERFVQATQKAIERLQSKNASPTPPVSNPDNQSKDDHFFVRTNYKMEKVEFKNIRFIKSMREYVSIYTTSQRFMVNQTMNKMETELPSDQFMRVHRSYIVALSQIQKIEGNQIVMKDEKIPIGASYRKAFFDKIRLL
jgi:DNA-binding LytR/AlgR family response regulator